MSADKKSSRALLALGVFAALVLGGGLLYALFAEPLLRALSEVLPGAALSKLAAPPGDTGGSPHRLRDDPLFALWTLACTSGLLLSVAAIYRAHVRDLVVRFFNAEAHPLTLALFRIVLFTFAAFLYSKDYYLLFSTLPEVFLSPPVGMNWLLSVLPINPTTVTWAYHLFVLSSLLAAVGAYTRVSALLALVLGVYVLGIPNFFGKIDHYNHLIFFMAIMAVSPCADTLSVDAFRRAWRHGDWTPRASRAYALPLRFIWLLMAVAYLFPGLYKLATGGFAWILGDNFRNIMFRNWVSLGEWVPFLRLDSSPLLYQGGAAAAVAFELAFVLLIFFPLLRPVVAVVGFSFHSVTNLVMRIPFYSLQIAYLTFVDWHRVFTWLGAKIYPQEARLVYDERTVLGRTLGAVRVLDLFGRVNYIPRKEQEAAQGASGPYFEVGAERRVGMGALRGLCARVLVLWPLLPFLFLLPDTLLGQKQGRSLPTKASALPRAAKLAPIVLVGTLLVSVNLAFGLVRIKDGWPFALYPVFGGIAGPTASYIQVAKVSPEGEEVVVDLQAVNDKFGYGKLQALLKAATVQDAQQESRVEALWSLLEQETDIKPSDSGRFYYATYYVDPARWQDNPGDVQLIVETRRAKEVLNE